MGTLTQLHGLKGNADRMKQFQFSKMREVPCRAKYSTQPIFTVFSSSKLLVACG